MAYMDTIVTLDETMISLHTLEMKNQPKRWVKKRTPGPVKAKVQASRNKVKVLACFDSKELVYTNSK